MDLNKFFNNVQRIADALDALAEMKKDGKVVLPTVAPEPAVVADEINPEVEAHVEETAEPVKPTSDADDKLRREFLKGELRKMNVPHAAAARTKTLEALYQDKLKHPDGDVNRVEPLLNPPAEKPEPAALPSDPDPEPAATIEQARAALVAFTAKAGKEKAVALLVQIGGAPQLSKCDPSKFAEIVRICREALR